MNGAAQFGQRDYMRKLVAELGARRQEVCAAYAEAERQGLVPRKRNAGKLAPDDYADRLWRDGVGKKAWLKV